MSWEKVSLFDCSGREVFMDEYGFCRVNFNGILINGNSTSDLFEYNVTNKRYERYRFGQSGDYSKELESLFNLDLAKRKKTNQPYYNYLYGLCIIFLYLLLIFYTICNNMLKFILVIFLEIIYHI